MPDNQVKPKEEPGWPDLAVDAAVSIPLARGDGVDASFITFRGMPADTDHFALRLGPPGDRPPLVRLHSECVTGDVFGSQRCDCRAQLDEALALIAAEGGYILYLRQEGRGIGLAAKLRAYRLQDQGLDTFAANVALGHPEDGRAMPWPWRC